MKFCGNQLKKWTLEKFLDPIWDLVLKRVSKFVIPEFRDTLLVPKITKCGDLLYKLFREGLYSVYRTGPKTLLAEVLLKKTLQAKVSLKDDRVVTKKLSTRWIWRSQSNRNTIGKVRSLKKKKNVFRPQKWDKKYKNRGL